MNWFVNLRTRTKLTIGFASITLFVLVVGLAGFWALRHTSHAITEVSDNRLPSLLALNVINEAQTAIKAANRSTLITGIPDEGIDAGQRESTAAFARAAQAWNIYAPLPQTPEEARAWMRFVPAWEAWKADIDEINRLIDGYQKTKSKELLERASEFTLGRQTESLRRAEALLAELIRINNAEVQRQIALVRTIADHNTQRMLVTVGLAITLAAGLTLVITRSIVAPLKACVQAAEQIAVGEIDFALDTTRRDEPGQLQAAMQRMADAVRAMLGDSDGVLLKAAAGEKLSTRAKTQITMLRQTIDVHPDAAYWVGADNRLVYVNEEACRRHGYTRKELLGSLVSLISPSASLPEGMGRIWQEARDHGFHRLETVHGRKDGTEFPVEMTATHVRIGGEEFLCGFAKDITERKNAENALRERETMYRLLFELESDALVLIEVGSFKILDANKAASVLYGHSHEELLGMKVRDLSAEPEESEKTIATRTTRTPLRRHRRRDGTEFLVETSSVFFTLHGREVSLSTIRDITEREKSEAGRLAAEQRLTALVEFLPDAMFAIDEQKRVIAWNQACETLTGVKKEAVLGLGDYAYSVPFYGDRRPIIIDLLDKPESEIAGAYKYVSKKGDTLTGEGYLPALRGGVHLWGVAAPLFDAAGRRCGGIEVIRDVSERKRVDQALRESELKYRALFDSAADAILLMRGNRIIECNARALTMYGCSREQLVGATPIDFSPPAQPDGRLSLEKGPQLIERAMREGAQFFEWQHCRADRTAFAAEVSLNRLELAGEILLQAIVRDVSEHKRDAARLQLIMETVPVGIAHVTDVRFTEVNDCLCEMLGYTREWMIGRNVASVFASPDSAAQVLPDFQRRLAAGESIETEISLRHRSGREVDLLLRLSRVDNSDPLAGTVCAMMDITHLKQARALQEAKAHAEASNRAKSAFLANMSHEIRTPLNAVLGFAQLLERDRGLSPQQREQVEIIARNGDHLLELINSILEMSKIEASRVVLDPKVFDFRALLAGLESAFRGRAQAKGLALSVALDPNAPSRIFGDSGRIRQILLNLMGNAVKFTSQGGISIRAACQRTEGCNCRLTVEVEDTGPGISPEEQALLFRPFVQAVEGRRINTGTGLGLVISRELARLMGGDVTVTSQLGRGSIFRMEIQIGCPESTDEEVVVLHPKEVLSLKEANGPCRILIVDDAIDNRRLLVSLLGHVGFEVKEAKDGVEAVDRFLDWSPHAILMDLRMPVMDGAEAISRIRSVPAGRVVKILALTASTFEENRRAMLQIGTDDFLGKPFVAADLLEKLRVLLSLSYVYSEAPKTVTATPLVIAVRPSLSNEDLAVLRRSAESGNLAQLLGRIASIETRHPEFAQELRALAENFQYDRLLALAGGGKNEK